MSENNDIEFIKKPEQLTDRELQEMQTNLLREIKNSTESIMKNVQFFFWVCIIGMGCFLILYYQAINP